MSPPKLDYSHSTYLTISTQVAPESILLSPSSPVSSTFSPSQGGSSSQSSSSSSLTTRDDGVTSLQYVGPVGELRDEHIYELRGVPSSNPPSREVQDVEKWLRGQSGVKAVEVMVPRTRSRKRIP